MRRSLRLAAVAAAGALLLAACGSSDDVADLADDIGAQSEDAPSGDDGSDSGDDGSAGDEGPGFGDMVSGTFAFSGAESETYEVDDPAYDIFGGGGCGGGQFGVSANARDVDTNYTVFQLGASIDADLDGGGTGTFDVEEMTLLMITDGDMAAGRGYRGPGTMTITEHDTGGADSQLNERRMAITLEGTLEATSLDLEGTVDVAADFVWVMGCP